MTKINLRDLEKYENPEEDNYSEEQYLEFLEKENQKNERNKRLLEETNVVPINERYEDIQDALEFQKIMKDTELNEERRTAIDRIKNEIVIHSNILENLAKSIKKPRQQTYTDGVENPLYPFNQLLQINRDIADFIKEEINLEFGKLDSNYISQRQVISLAKINSLLQEEKPHLYLLIDSLYKNLGDVKLPSGEKWEKYEICYELQGGLDLMIISIREIMGMETINILELDEQIEMEQLFSSVFNLSHIEIEKLHFEPTNTYFEII